MSLQNGGFDYLHDIVINVSVILFSVFDGDVTEFAL